MSPRFPRLLQEATHLLARAALAPEQDAREAWQAWRRLHDIDSTPWNQVRLLGAVASRIHWLEPDAAIRPRVLGIRKFLWVQNQICLKHAIGGVAALTRAGIPALLMKGAARIACDRSAARERLIRDVDVLVPPGQEERAFSVLEAEGWSLVPLEWQIAFRKWSHFASHHAWALQKEKSEIDLHHFSNYLNRLCGDDDGLWRRGRSVDWQGAAFMVPAPADALLIALVHGVRWSTDAAADWTIDASKILDERRAEDRIDWAIFLEEARRRMIQSILLCGLQYLRDALGKPVPAAVLDALETQRDPEQDAELAQYAASPEPIDLPGIRTAANMASRRALSRAGVQEPRSGEKAVTKPIERFSIELPSAGQRVWFPSPHAKCASDWVQVRVDVARHVRADQAPPPGIFETPGLVLYLCQARVLPGETDATYVVRIPSALLALRGVEKIAFRVATGQGAPPGTSLPATITSFALSYPTP